jgi:hypothetical protein
MTAALAQSTGELAALDPNDPGRTRVLQDQGEPTAGVQGRLHAAGNDGHAGRPVQSLPPSTKYPRAHRSGCKAVIRVYIVNSTFGGASGQLQQLFQRWNGAAHPQPGARRRAATYSPRIEGAGSG